MGPKGKHNPDRSAKRHGHEDGSLTLAPAACACAGRGCARPVTSASCRCRRTSTRRSRPAHAGGDGPDARRCLVAQVRRVGEPVGSEVEPSCSATSKSSVSEMFVERTATALSDLMSRRLEDVRLAVMMIDGMEIAERTHVARSASAPTGSDPARVLGRLDREACGCRELGFGC